MMTTNGTKNQRFASVALMSAIFAIACAANGQAEGVKICVVESVSGDFAIYGIPKLLGYRLAAKEINEAGGLMGKPLQMVYYDGQSNVQRFQEFGQKCVLDDEADVIMGGTTSSEREALRAVAVKSKKLYWHNNTGEGGIADHYSFFSASVPEEQIVPAVEYMIKKYGPKVYGAFADYGYGQVSAIWVKATVAANGGKMVGLEYVPLGNSDYASTIANIQKAKPDWFYSSLVGAAQFNFFPQANAGGLAIPKLLPINVQLSYEHKRYPAPVMDNSFVSYTFLEELAATLPSAKKFVDGIRALDPGIPYVNEMARDAYVGMNLTAMAIKRAASTDTEKMIDALQSGLYFDAPEGRVFLDPATHHLSLTIRMAQVTKTHALEPVAEFPAGVREPWWLRSLGVNLVKQSPSTQYVPWDDPHMAKYKSQ
jgi:urea ABC transporter substrate-binding protein